MRRMLGMGLMQLIVILGVIGFVGVMAAKLMPSYIDYFNVKKVFAGMEQAGETQGTVREIRIAFDRRNAIEDIKAIRADDIEVTKEGGETILTANWSARVPMVSNISACIDFTVTTAKQ